MRKVAFIWYNLSIIACTYTMTNIVQQLYTCDNVALNFIINDNDGV